jgi:hypothetical protein
MPSTELSGACGADVVRPAPFPPRGPKARTIGSMPQTRSHTTYIPADADGRDVISVSVTPLATGLSDGESPTAGALVTVVWHEG